jgi:adenosylhomocysteinase
MQNMPLLTLLKKEFEVTKPFSDNKITISIHLEAKTAYFAEVLAASGAQVTVTGSNPLSTQDDVAAALVEAGLTVYAWHNASTEEYTSHIEKALENFPHIIIDDGGDLTSMLHFKRTDLMENLYGGCEETTTGILRLRSMERENLLKIPMIAVNNASCKYLFDNRYGTGQSVWDGINRTTNLIVAGKHVVVAGYGWCGKGVAMRAKGLGAKVIVTEIDPIKAMEAVMDGFDVMTMNEAAAIGDFFITVTGCDRVIHKEHFPLMKDGVILCNAGHFDCEINLVELNELAIKTKEQRKNIMGYMMEDGRWINVLGEGRLVNLACGDGHPAEIMDMSFSLQLLSAKYMLENHDSLLAKVYDVPKEIDMSVAEAKLKTWGISIDKLTTSQEEYLKGWG